MMNDDRLLQALGKAAREERPPDLLELDERWDRLAAGTLSPAEDAELRALAETSEAARQAYEMFRPLDAAFHERVVDKLRKQRDAEKPVRVTKEPSFPVEPLHVPRFWAWKAWLSGGVATAAAAATALSLALMPPSSHLPFGLAVGALILGEDVPSREWEGGALPPAGPTVHPCHAGTRLTVVAPLTGDLPKLPQSVLGVGLFLVRGREAQLLKPREEDVRWRREAVRFATTVEGPIREHAEWTPWILVGLREKLPDVRAFGAALSSCKEEVCQQRGWVARRSQDIVVMEP
ncbi:MAG TPA: hypothetical protein VGE98_09265 [Thermoanaerobaculia bacterium]